MIKKEFKNVLKITIVFTLLLLLLTVSAAFADEETTESEMILKPAGSEDAIPLKAMDVDGTQYFFLPSGVEDEEIESAPGEPVSYETMQSANIASLHFFSSDPEKGIAYVHKNKDMKAPGKVILYDENFDQLYQGSVEAIKGRGNTTWNFTDKKSYQIKLDKKADLLDPVNSSQKAKKWILLANPFDPTLMRNYMIYDFAKEIGLQSTPEGRPVDFYYDGEYRGSYYLCEKVEIGDGRVEIDELEKAVEKANSDVDFDELTEVTGTTARGLAAKYEEGITDPEDISGGYLVELDSVYYEGEKSWFRYAGLCAASVKSPEYNSAAMIDYISGYLADLYWYCWDANHGKNDGSKLPDMIDMESFAKYFLVNEWFGNNDVWTSSTFMYKPKGDDKLYAGPVWDCDSSMHTKNDEETYDIWFAFRAGLEPMADQLFKMPVFRQKVKEVYEKDFRSVIFDILLGTENGEYLRPAAAIHDELSASSAMDFRIWGINDCLGSYSLKSTPEENYQDIVYWMEKRAEWVDKEIMSDSFAPRYSRIYGDTRYETSLKAADAYKRQLGVDKFDSVILACGSNYADALAGSYLSAVKKAPILLVSPRQDHIDAVQAFIKKNLAEGGTVYQLGGEAVVPESSVAGLEGYEVKRLWGSDRYATNVAILEEAGTEGDEILVASGIGFADSLSASATGKPILLVKNIIQESQKEYIETLKDKKIYIIGGTGAVNESLEEYFRKFGTVTRLGGATRYDTSAKVADTFFSEPEGTVIAYGANFPDGLCGGSLANAMGGPLLLAANGKTDAAASYVKKSGIKDGTVLGGPALISNDSADMIFS